MPFHHEKCLFLKTTPRSDAFKQLLTPLLPLVELEKWTFLTLLTLFQIRFRQGQGLVGEPTRASSWAIGSILHRHSSV